MANYATLKAAINAVIKTNGNKEITGQVLNQTLMAIVDSLGENYQFAGVAVPSTNPGTPDQNIFYLATQAGTYTNFSAIVLPAGISFLEWNGSWSSETLFTIDDAPTEGSGNLVKSGGVKTAIDNIAFSTGEKVKDVGITDTLTSGSDSIITSGAVFDAFKNDGGAYDVSVHFPTGGVEGGNTYTLDGAIAKVPQNIQKGGMSIKFIQSSDNKYVQARLLTKSFSDNPANWQEETGAISYILPFTTDVSTTRLLIPSYKREVGLRITYVNNNRLVTEKFFGTTFNTEQWSADENWREEADTEDTFLLLSSFASGGIGNLIAELQRGNVNSSGVLVESTGYRRSDYIPVTQGKAYKVYGRRIIGFNSSKEPQLDVIPEIAQYTYTIVEIPKGISYVVVSSDYLHIDAMGLWEYPNSIEENSLKLNGGDYIKIKGFMWYGGSIKADGSTPSAPTSAYKHSILFPVTPNETLYVCSYAPTYNTTKAFAFYQSDGTTLVSVTESDYYERGSKDIYSLLVPAGASYVRLQTNTDEFSTENAGIYKKNFLPNKSTLDKFSESNGKLLWDNLPIESEQSLNDIVVDLPVSDGTDIQSGYAYIDSTDRCVKVKA